MLEFYLTLYLKNFSGYFLVYSVMPCFLMGSVFFLLSLKLIQINAFKWSNILIPFGVILMRGVD